MAAAADDGGDVVVFARDYAGSIAALNSTQLRGDALRRHFNGRTACVEAMRIYLGRLGLSEGALRRIPTLHVTGSKGKGSTCAFVEAVLRAKGLRTVLFSSPHLVKPNERIRLDGKPLTDALWAKHFWAVWDRIHQNLPPAGQPPPDQQQGTPGPDPVPGYFRLLTLLCLWVAVEEGADALILEVGVGGRYDATNVVPAPLACGVTRLDLEHTDTLGDTIGKIAWEKGGIVKPGARVCVVGEQAPGLEAEALPVLEDCTSAANVPLLRVTPLPPTVALSMVGDFQRANAAVAVALAHQLLAAREGGKEKEQQDEWMLGAGSAGDGRGLIDVSGVVAADPVVQRALAACSWPGRCQRVSWGGCHLYIDGAHTEQSMRAAVAWYDGQMAGTAAGARGARCLFFHCGEEKAVGELLGHLVGGAPEQQPPEQQPRFGLVVFCPVASARPTLATVRPARELLLTGPTAGDAILAALCDALEEEEATEPQAAERKGEASGQPWQRALRGAWRVLQAAQLLDDGRSQTILDPTAARALLAEADAQTRTVVCPSVAAALQEVAPPAGEKRPPPKVLVTGSLYLVGNVLSLVAEE